MILNLFPYTNGHLMVAPYEHVGDLQEISAETLAEMMALAQRAMGRLEEVYTRTATTSASTRAGSPAPGSSTTSTSTSCRAGAATTTSCR